jgi:uncharacterized protein
MGMMRVWAKDEPFGTEVVDVTLSGSTLTASGLAIGTEPAPYRLEYQLVTAERYVTTRLAVQTAGSGWRRALVLERAASGVWTCTGHSEGDLDRSLAGIQLCLSAHWTATSACRR